MLKKRVIPIVLIDGFSVLKTIRFKDRRNLGSPITVMRTYNTRNVDELIILDIDASRQHRPIDKFVINEISQDCLMPLTVGGGIKTLKDIEDLLRAGADKISLNSAALRDLDFVREAAQSFGSQCIVASVDIVKTGGEFCIFNRSVPTSDIILSEHLEKLFEAGAGELLINNVDKDGTMSGSEKDLGFLEQVDIKIPIIYAGGINSPLDAAETLARVSVDALGISSIFHFTDYTPNEVSKELGLHGYPVRI
jgi:imidazole glycerol-phosphate synthase subunit HisF